MATPQKYTGAMEATLRNIANENDGLDMALCNEIAAFPEFEKAGITGRSIIAKARSMGLPYNKVERVTKTGQPVMKKDDIVQEIENLLNVKGLDSLSKSEKPALRILADAVKALVSQNA